MAKGKGFHTLLFPGGQAICAGHAAAVIRWARLCLSVIVRTVSPIRPLVPWLAAVPSNTIAHLIISISQPPYFSVEGSGSHSQAVRDHERLGPFVHHSIYTLAAPDKVWCRGSPQNGSIFFSSPPACRNTLSFLPPVLVTPKVGHIQCKTLFTNPTWKSFIFFQTDTWHSLWICRLLLLHSYVYATIHFLKFLSG